MEDVRLQRGANSFFTRTNSAANGTPDTRRNRSQVVDEKKERDPYDVPQMEHGYPEPSSHGVLPAYGLFISHARGVTIDNVTLETINEDKRPPIVLMDVEDVKFSNMKVDKSDEVPYIVLRDVENFEVENFRNVKDKVISVAKDKQIDK